MCSSASSISPSGATSPSGTIPSRYGRCDRVLARLLVVALLAMTPITASGGDEFEDANNTTFDGSVVTLDNSQAGQTTFDIDTNSTTIGWEDLQQPEGNTLEFNFSDPNSMVLNDIGSQHASQLNGTVLSNGTVAFANPFGVFIGDTAVIDVGNLVAIGGSAARDAFLTSEAMLVPLSGTVQNDGLILADGNVALLGRNVINNGEIIARSGHILAIAGRTLHLEDWDGVRADFQGSGNFLDSLIGDSVENHGSMSASSAALIGNRIMNFGEIEIADGSLMMVGADSVWITEFDNPVLIKVPNYSEPAATNGETGGSADGDGGADPIYAIENHGRVDAGLGHVRLAASDPLGFAIRQGSGSAEAPASIAAHRIELEGGETGRLHLEGSVAANDFSDDGVGGAIDITGSMIVLDGATIEASGSTAGGTIHIGGEQQGTGDLQRARVVYVDEDTQIRADATVDGDGGRVILFAEDLTNVDGEVSARGGSEGGDGGFVETSGLRSFVINSVPDVTAPSGDSGSWLIDPWNIQIVANATDCTTEGDSCFNKAIEAILEPNFDQAGFDGILRTIDPASNTGTIGNPNNVSASLIEDALATGTDVTLSTQAFGTDTGTEDGNIDVNELIQIDNSEALEGTSAKLTLLAARNINVNSRIESVEADGVVDGRTNLALSVELRANDLGQVQSDRDYDNDLIQGDVNVNADIRTGGGDVTLYGISVVQQQNLTIDTDGGSVDIRTGTIETFGNPAIISRRDSDPVIDPATPQPILQIGGTIDTRDTNGGADTGGSVDLLASSINVSTSQSGNDLLDVVTGLLEITSTGQIQTGGGDIRMNAGSPVTFFGENFAGNVSIAGDLFSGGGDVMIDAFRVDPSGDTGDFDVVFLDPVLGEGGVIDVQHAAGRSLTTEGGYLSIGSEITQSVQLDGTFDTRADILQVDTSENGLIRIVAEDATAVDTADAKYGQGEVVIGARGTTTIDTAGLSIVSRNVTFSDGAGANAVTVVASGSSTATPLNFIPDEGATVVERAEAGIVEITGVREVIFNQNTEITGETIRVDAGIQPLALSDPDPPAMSERPNSETRLVFGGTNGAGQTAADGVRLNGTTIELTVGDGSTNTFDGLSQDTGTAADPTDFGLIRLTTGAYDGLQLRSVDDSSLRPEEFSLAQDADLTITNSAPTGDGQLDLGGAFDTATIGSNGMHATLESSDGVLTIEDAAALNNGVNAGVVPGSDDDKSFVVLNGGVFLPDPLTVPTPVDDTVVFGDGVTPLGMGGTTAFDLESLTVSTAGNFTVSQQIVDSISSANELVFQAGRPIPLPSQGDRGTLTIDPGLTLQAGERLALWAGAEGFGDLVFSGPSTTLVANDIDLRAGAGVDSVNTDTAARSRITGLQANVTMQDALGATFGDAASSATAFSYRQDAAIDAQTDLPDLTQFGLMPGTGFRSAGDLAYAVRSDQGSIDLDDETPGTNEGERFMNAALSLIGLQSSAGPAIDVSDEFSFVGKRIELGGVSDFTFTQILATAFNRSGTDVDEEMTLRAGVGSAGVLRFDRGSQTSVIVKAPTVNLVAGNGFELGDEAQFESTIDVANASFDLLGPAGSTPTFVYHTDSQLDVSDLPDASQFIGGNAGLPDVLVMRTDLAAIEFDDFDATLLPLDLTDDPGRLVLEAESITLTQSDGDDLVLTDVPNLKLRFRTNNLTFRATDISLTPGVDTDGTALVLVGPQTGDTQVTVGMDSDFDDESLLIEAFDRDATIATSANLSVLSADPNMPGQFDLNQARGPTTIALAQDGEVVPSDLFLRTSVAGLFAQSSFDDEDGNPVATTYLITSRFNPVTIEPENVNASRLSLFGLASSPLLDGITFGEGPAPGVFDFDSLFASTESSITIADGTQLSATDTLSIAAGVFPTDADDPGLVFGKLTFEAGGLTTSLTGNTVRLTAGPSFQLDSPGATPDDDPIPIPDILLPRIDFQNLDQIVLTGDPETSLLDIKQSANLLMTDAEGDFLTPVVAGMGADKWSSLILDVIQGNLEIDDLDILKDVTETLTGRNTTLGDAQITVNVPDAAVTSSPFDDFDGMVEFDSNDITFVSTDPNTSIDLATDNLVLLSFAQTAFGTPDDELGTLRDGDPDIENRPIVTIEQAADFDGLDLPHPDQYIVINEFGQRLTRSDLSGIDIRLKTTGTILTVDDDVRARVSFSNLILDSGGDIDIVLNGATPGYDGLDYAELQLTSLRATTPDGAPPGLEDGVGDGTIAIRQGGGTNPLTLSTTGDQEFNGFIDLDKTFSTAGRDITFKNDVMQAGAPDAGLRVSTRGQVGFEGNIGSVAAPINHFWIGFDTRIDDTTPSVQFGRRDAMNDDAPIDSDQEIHVLEHVLFTAYDFFSDLTEMEISLGLDAITQLTGVDSVESFLDDLGLGRDRAAGFATIGKALGDLAINVTNGHFIMASGEKLSVGGDASITTNTSDGLATLGDVSALGLTVTASDIGLVRRQNGVNLDHRGETQQDAGATILANTIDFGPIAPTQFGSGRGFRFGVPDPWDTANLPAFLGSLPLFEINADGSPLDTSDFRFDDTTGELATRVPSLRPNGSSRSELSGAFGPKEEPGPTSLIPEPQEPVDTSPLLELSIDAVPTPNRFRLARLAEAGVIDDLELGWIDENAEVTTARLDATDALAAIALYDELFGPEGEKTDEVHAVLQDALDKYLLNTRARRVIGFELRRFVKNRPSTLLDAYKTLESLDTLFRYHRRIGLSPGEYRRIQLSWLRRIQPEGITLDELSEAIHPSRYVRGSDILDIFGE